MLEILCLGTGGSVPSRDRALPAVAVKRGPDVFLFDCGEGTQRQLMVSPFSFMHLRAVFITHLHGDHFYGLPGLLQTMGLMGRTAPLTVAGPAGMAAAVKASLETCPGEIPYVITVTELGPGDSVRFNEVTVTAFATVHGVPSVGLRLQEDDGRPAFDREKAAAHGITGRDFAVLEQGGEVNGATLADVSGPGRKGLSVVYTGDTAVCDSVCKAAKGADVLVHEATYMDTEKELAAAHWHSTARQAAETAKKAGCGALILVHTSNRYKDRTPLAAEAQAVFGKTFVPDDLALFNLSKSGLRPV